MAKVDRIVVEKNKRQMTVYRQKEVLRTYRIALGFAPIGHKEQAGDGKTPEGNYYIQAKNPNSQFHQSLKVSYPSKKDKLNAAQKGVSAGGDIMIHGLSKYLEWLGAKHILRDWTLGHIAITNEEINEIYSYIEIGTSIEIQP